MIRKVVSGGQTGVDRAALDAAQALGIPIGGWCPRGRRAEDGPIDARYPLRETPLATYPQRTECNVRDSDGTLVLTDGRPRGGTALTIAIARALGRPLLVIDLAKPADAADVRHWIADERVAVLNVAGPRESQRPGIYSRALRFVEDVLRAL